MDDENGIQLCSTPPNIPLFSPLFSVVMVVIVLDCVSLIEDEIALPLSLAAWAFVRVSYVHGRAVAGTSFICSACPPRHLALDLLRRDGREEGRKKGR